MHNFGPEYITCTGLGKRHSFAHLCTTGKQGKGNFGNRLSVECSAGVFRRAVSLRQARNIAAALQPITDIYREYCSVYVLPSDELIQLVD